MAQRKGHILFILPEFLYNKKIGRKEICREKIKKGNKKNNKKDNKKDNKKG